VSVAYFIRYTVQLPVLRKNPNHSSTEWAEFKAPGCIHKTLEILMRAMDGGDSEDGRRVVFCAPIQMSGGGGTGGDRYGSRGKAVLLLLSCGFLLIDGCSDRFAVGYDGQVRPTVQAQRASRRARPL